MYIERILIDEVIYVMFSVGDLSIAEPPSLTKAATLPPTAVVTTGTTLVKAVSSSARWTPETKLDSPPSSKIAGNQKIGKPLPVKEVPLYTRKSVKSIS